jgi:hypothetical protein
MAADHAARDLRCERFRQHLPALYAAAVESLTPERSSRIRICAHGFGAVPVKAATWASFRCTAESGAYAERHAVAPIAPTMVQNDQIRAAQLTIINQLTAAHSE